MKNIKTYFILLLLFGFASSFAQGIQPATKDRAQDTKTHEDSGVLTEEQALLITAGDFNPAKIEEAGMLDRKMDPAEMATEADYGESNARASEISIEDMERAAATIQKELPVIAGENNTPVSEGSQPAGETIGTIPDFRILSGGDKTQPQGEQTGTVTDYREMQGSAVQPAGDAPDK